MMRERFYSYIRIGIGAVIAMVMVCLTAACSPTSQSEETPSANTSSSTEPLTLVASLNQWGSLASQIGGEYVTVSSILTSTTADAHDFEATSKDMKTLHNADVVLVNGAGYDSWANKNLPSNVTCVSVGEIVGAMDGDNPHLWFSRDARFAVASELADVFSRLRPAYKKTFAANLDAWKKREETLEKTIHDFSNAHPDLSYAATEDVAYYLMSDMKFDDKTPDGYQQAIASESEPAPADLRSMQTLLSDKGVNLLINNPQETTDSSENLVDIAQKASVPVQSVTEQMPSEYKTLTDWIEGLFEQIAQKVDPEYTMPSEEEQDSASSTPSTTQSAQPNESADTSKK